MWPFKKAKSEKPFEIAHDHAILNYYAGTETNFRVPETYENLPVTEIAPNAFRDAKHVKAVYTGANIRKIGKKAFFGCADDLRLILNPGAEREEGALMGVKSVYFENETGLTLVSYAGQETELRLEDECFGKKVTGIGEKVFYMFAYLKSIRLPSNLRIIGSAAFAGCSDLAGIDFPGTLEAIAPEAFFKSGLKAVVFPESLKNVGEHAFMGCAELEKAVFKGKNTHLSSGAFARCALTEIVLPENFTELQSEVLRENRKLTHVRIPETVEAVWEYALADTGLKDIGLPESVEVIGEGAFANSKALESVRLGRNIREIGQSAFSFCPNLKSLSLTEGRFRLESGLLIDTEKRRVIVSLAQMSPAKVSVPEGITEISDSAFAGNDKIESLILPESVVRLGAWALRDMKKLNYLEIKAENVAFGDSPLFGTYPEEFICTDEIADEIAEMEA